MKESNESRVRPKIRDDGVVILDRIDPFMQTCSGCGREDDCRPYGKNGAWVCFDCGMKDPDEAERQFLSILSEFK